jgi:hypothetical protein
MKIESHRIPVPQALQRLADQEMELGRRDHDLVR